MPYRLSIILFLGICFMQMQAWAQSPFASPFAFPRRWSVGLQMGTMTYYGDLSENLKTIALSRPGVSTWCQYRIHSNLALQAGFLKGSVQGDDRMGNLSQLNWKRGLAFRSPIHEAYLQAKVHFLDNHRQLRPYFAIGFGIFHFNPKADLFQGSPQIQNRYVFAPDGSIRNIEGEVIQKDGVYETNLHEWKTEGADNPAVRASSRYSRIQWNVPVSLGFLLALTTKWEIQFDLGIRYLFTDYLDDVSSRYSSEALIESHFDTETEREMATYISNPGGVSNPIRGNELRNDVYVFSSICLVYRFGEVIIPKLNIDNAYRPDYKETWAFGLGGGFLFLHGDMRDHKVAPTLINRGFPNRSDLQTGGSVYVSHYISPLFGVKAEVISGTLSSTRQPEFTYTPLMEGSMSMMLNITNSFPRYKPYARKVDWYAQAGIGRALAIGSVRTVADGQTVRYTGPGVFTTLPIGTGIRIHVGKSVDLDINYTYRHVNSDLLDATRSGYDRPMINQVKDGYSWFNVSVAWVLLKAAGKMVDPFRGIKKRVFDQLNIDTDGDGIPDFRDAEPNTLAGMPVGPNGKPIDRDGDDVGDIFDYDPFTPSGLWVDRNGMPADRDRDGVPDYRDLEPDSPPGTVVNFKGQSWSEEKESEFILQEKLAALRPMLSTWNFLMIYFDFDKSEIKEAYYEPLSRLASLLEDIPELSLKCIGHADIRGNRAYNLKLSERRALAVQHVLAEIYGIDKSRFRIEGLGKEQPHTEYISQAAQGSNRRVELRLMLGDKELTE